MDYQELLRAVTPELYQRMKHALELGRWPDGSSLTTAQRENCMQAVIAYERLHVAEQDRVGYIDRAGKAGAECEDVETQPLQWRD